VGNLKPAQLAEQWSEFLGLIVWIIWVLPRLLIQHDMAFVDHNALQPFEQLGPINLLGSMPSRPETD
jgi:hypothetical protein